MSSSSFLNKELMSHVSNKEDGDKKCERKAVLEIGGQLKKSILSLTGVHVTSTYETCDACGGAGSLHPLFN
jgi:hypothetical protein